MTKKTEKIDINEIEGEYLNLTKDDVLWSDWGDSERQLKILNIIKKELSEIDRRVILLYAETGSQRETGRLLNVSASTANIRINEIRKKIKKLLYDRDNNQCDAD